jgi:hypothetical protein
MYLADRQISFVSGFAFSVPAYLASLVLLWSDPAREPRYLALLTTRCVCEKSDYSIPFPSEAS